MKAKIVITPDGEVGVFTQSGTFIEGKEAIKKLLAKLEDGGVKFSGVSDVEQHRHDDQHTHQHIQVNA